MLGNTASRTLLLAVLLLVGARWSSGAEATAEKDKPPQNLLSDPSFELGTGPWKLDVAGKTVAQYAVDAADAAVGRKSALVRIGAVEASGIQFGQDLATLEPGKTYTFAVLAKSAGEPVSLRLDVRRAAEPRERVAWAPPIAVGRDGWRELHATFKVDKPCPEGWTARVGCQQPDAEFRLDLFRLYEGEYVASPQAANPLKRSGNLFENPSLERGTQDWSLVRNVKTAARLAVDSAEAADGRQSALVSIDEVDGYGIHFLQNMEAPAPGKVCTFAVQAKGTKGPVSLGLEVQRAGPPWDVMVRSELMKVTGNTWKELHVTFKAAKPCPEGWIAFVSCKQPNAEFRLDDFRLYEGKYVPSGSAGQGPATTVQPKGQSQKR
jgi:hypothetical protein